MRLVPRKLFPKILADKMFLFFSFFFYGSVSSSRFRSFLSFSVVLPFLFFFLFYSFFFLSLFLSFFFLFFLIFFLASGSLPISSLILLRIFASSCSSPGESATFSYYFLLLRFISTPLLLFPLYLFFLLCSHFATCFEMSPSHISIFIFCVTVISIL